MFPGMSLLFPGLGPGTGKGLFVHAEVAALVLAHGLATGAEQPALADLVLIPPADPVLMAAQDLTRPDLMVLEQLLLAPGALDGQHLPFSHSIPQQPVHE